MNNIHTQEVTKSQLENKNENQSNINSLENQLINNKTIPNQNSINKQEIIFENQIDIMKEGGDENNSNQKEKIDANQEIESIQQENQNQGSMTRIKFADTKYGNSDPSLLLHNNKNSPSKSNTKYGKNFNSQKSLSAARNSEINFLLQKQKNSPYLGSLDEKDIKIMQLTQVNEQLKQRVTQLTEALETSLYQRQQYQKIHLDQKYDTKVNSLYNTKREGSQDHEKNNYIQQEDYKQNYSEFLSTDALNQHIDPKRLESLQKIIKEKDKECQSYMNIIAQLKKENSKIKNQNQQKSEVKTLENLIENLQKSEKLNEQLKQELSAMKRIQSEQSRALNKMVFENNYPMKIKGLIDELKNSKDKIKEIEDELSREQRVSHQYQYNNQMLIDQIRDLKQKLSVKINQIQQADNINLSVIGGDSQAIFEENLTLINATSSNNFHNRSKSVLQNATQFSSRLAFQKQQNDDQNLNEEKLKKQVQIITNSKESLLRKHQIQESKMQKKLEKFEKENKKIQLSLIEKDKQIQLQQIKLREFLQKNLKELPLKTFDEIEDIIQGKDKDSNDVYGTHNKQNGRRMADTYKKIREIAQKYSSSDLEMEQMLSKYMTNKGKMLNSITDRNNLFVRNKQLQALEFNNSKLSQRNQQIENLNRTNQSIHVFNDKQTQYTPNLIEPKEEVEGWANHEISQYQMNQTGFQNSNSLNTSKYEYKKVNQTDQLKYIDKPIFIFGVPVIKIVVQSDDQQLIEKYKLNVGKINICTDENKDIVNEILMMEKTEIKAYCTIVDTINQSKNLFLSNQNYKVFYYGIVGDDDYGNKFQDYLNQNNIDSQFLQKIKGIQTSVQIELITNGIKTQFLRSQKEILQKDHNLQKFVENINKQDNQIAYFSLDFCKSSNNEETFKNLNQSVKIATIFEQTLPQNDDSILEYFETSKKMIELSDYVIMPFSKIRNFSILENTAGSDYNFENAIKQISQFKGKRNDRTVLGYDDEGYSRIIIGKSLKISEEGFNPQFTDITHINCNWKDSQEFKKNFLIAFKFDNQI